MLVQQNAIDVAKLVISPVHARKALALAPVGAAAVGEAAGAEEEVVVVVVVVVVVGIKRHGMNSCCRLVRR